LQVSTPLGGFADEAPLAYQEGEGGQTLGVTVAYAAPEEQGGAYSYAFQVGAYDRSKPLVLDPAVLLYCGYIGGWASEGGSGIAVDGEGNAYVTGATNSSENTFPVAVGPDMSYNDEGYSDAFVAKVNAAGTALVYCGYIGGSGNDSGRGLAVDGEGNAYITGETGSSEDTFPVTVGPDLSYNGGGDYGDAFVAKVDAMGTALDYCGYIGGSGSDRALDIAVDGAGNAYITGGTASTEATFPVTVGPDLSYHGGDAFVAKVNAAGTALLYCGYIGGSDGDVGSGIAVDAAGNAYVTGITSSSEATFPVTVGPDLSFNEGRYHAFVGKVNAAGTALDYCGYIGGSGDDFGHGIAVDGAGNAYVTGYTYSSQATFPVAVGPDLSHNGYEDAFVAKVDATGAALDYCGYIGGSASDVGLGIAVDGEGNAYVTGRARSSEATFPVTVGPDLSHNGYEDAFVAKVDATGTVLLYCGYIGGSDVDGDEGSDIAVDEEGNAYVTGYTFSNQATFPVTVGPDLSFNGYNDAFVAKVSPVSVAVHVPLLLRPSSPTQ
jgi:hypothetical protein